MSSKNRAVKRNNHLHKRKQKELKRSERLKKKESKKLEYYIKLQQYQEINIRQSQRLEQLVPSFDKNAFALRGNTVPKPDTKTVFNNNKTTGFNRNLWLVDKITNIDESQ